MVLVAQIRQDWLYQKIELVLINHATCGDKYLVVLYEDPNEEDL